MTPLSSHNRDVRPRRDGGPALGGAFGLLHYLDYRATDDVDAWWTDTATEADRRQVRQILADVLRRTNPRGANYAAWSAGSDRRPDTATAGLSRTGRAYFVSDLIDHVDLSAITKVHEAEDRGYPPRRRRGSRDMANG